MFDIRHPEVMKIAAKNYAGFIGAGVTFMLLAQSMGAKVNWNPTSVDFGKAKIGGTHLDIWGGGNTNLRDMARLVLRQSTNEIGETNPLDFKAWAGNVVANKMAPGIKIPLNAIAGKDLSTGENYTIEDWPRILENSVLPMFAQDVIDAWIDGGWKRSMLAAPLSFVGVSTNTYQPKARGNSNYYHAFLQAAEREDAGAMHNLATELKARGKNYDDIIKSASRRQFGLTEKQWEMAEKAFSK